MVRCFRSVYRENFQMIKRINLVYLIIIIILICALAISMSETLGIYPRLRTNIQASLSLPVMGTSRQTPDQQNKDQRYLRLQNAPDQPNKYKRYLRLQNTLFGNFNERAVPRETRNASEDIIRSGTGLQPCKTDKGEDAWMENGIVFRPRDAKHSNNYTAEYVSYVPFDEDMFFEGQTPDLRYKTEKKIILWYTAPSYVSPKPDLHPMESCPDFPCAITTNASLYKNMSSAVIFAANKIWEAQPPERTSPDQVFVLHNHEAPRFFKYSKIDDPSWKRVFNYSFTYRMDADFVQPYGVVRKRPANRLLTKDYHGIFAKKTKTAVWAASKCVSSSKRENYVKSLLKHNVSIDIIGLCGKPDCPKTNRYFCNDQMAKKYKFYLAFENALCPDYITEKLFLYLQKDIVIVARGSNEYYRHLPPEIFINTNDFPSPKDLAKRLNYLASHEEAYLNILREKDKYMMMFIDHGILQSNGNIMHNDFVFDSVPLCLMCQRLWNLDKHRQTIKDAYALLLKGVCKSPKDLIG